MHLNQRYGAASVKMAPKVQALINRIRPRSILDYGAGKGMLRQSVKTQARFEQYDPCVPEISNFPKGKFDLVCCIDVLEHVEPEFLSDVLASLRSATGRVAFVTIHTGPAGKFLPDGRNAHLNQQNMDWWKHQLLSHFGKFEANMFSGTTIIAVCR